MLIQSLLLLIAAHIPILEAADYVQAILRPDSEEDWICRWIALGSLVAYFSFIFLAIITHQIRKCFRPLPTFHYQMIPISDPTSYSGEATNHFQAAESTSSRSQSREAAGDHTRDDITDDSDTVTTDDLQTTAITSRSFATATDAGFQELRNSLSRSSLASQPLLAEGSQADGSEWSEWGDTSDSLGLSSTSVYAETSRSINNSANMISAIYDDETTINSDH
ncbi:unnamed protein product, partial [Mesorhabditis spiculigera]